MRKILVAGMASGMEILALDGAGLQLDLTSAANGVRGCISGIETIDLTGGDNSLALAALTTDYP